MEDKLAVIDPCVDLEPSSEGASLTLMELAMLLKVDFGAARIDQSATFALRRVRDGAALYHAGDSFRAIYAIRSGSFKTELIDANGGNQVLGFLMTGDILGLEGIDSQRYQTETVALEDSEVAVISFPRLAYLARDAFGLQQSIYRLLSRKLAREQAIWLLGPRDAQARVGMFLLDLSRRYAELGYSGNWFNLRMTREEIGSFLGLKLETVSRVLSAFAAAGVIRVHNKELQILDITVLQRRVSTSPDLVRGRQPKVRPRPEMAHRRREIPALEGAGNMC